jgi:medium-chain acyl-[acyl-carrier-protein] hydrolase
VPYRGEGKVSLDRWLPYRNENVLSRCRLFCFPHAAGNSLVFRPWHRLLDGIDLCPVELPGRGARIDEAPFRRMDSLVDALCEVLPPLLKIPFALFGHSMGAYIAHALALRLGAAGGPAPMHLFVSGAAAPDRTPRNPPLHSLPDRELVGALTRFGGTPAAVLARDELVTALLPTLRADLTLAETYSAARSQPVSCSITAFGGSGDTIDRRALQGWSTFTDGAFRLRIFPGDHFYLAAAGSALADEIACDLHPPGLRTRPQRTDSQDGWMCE